MLQIHRPLKALTAVLLAAAIIGAYAGLPSGVLALLLIGVAIVVWFLPPHFAVRAYAVLLGIQLPHSTGLVFRPAVSDLLILPVLARTFLADPRSLWPRTRLRGPLVLMMIAFGIALIVGYLAIGRFSLYVLFNKTLGLMFLIGGAMLLTSMLRGVDDLVRMMRFFTMGVSVTNALVLVAVPLGMTIWPNQIYMVGSYRLFGTMLNPTAWGGLVITAAMIEMGLLVRGAKEPYSTLRWFNVWLLGISVFLTLSRSAWLSAGVAGGAFLVSQALQIGPRLRARPVFWITASVWALLPAAAMASILYVNRNVNLLKPPAERAAELHVSLVTGCEQYSLPGCEDVKGSPQQVAKLQREEAARLQREEAAKGRQAEALAAQRRRRVASPSAPTPASPSTPTPVSPSAPTPPSLSAPSLASPSAPSSASPSAPPPGSPSTPPPGSPSTPPPPSRAKDRAPDVVTPPPLPPPPAPAADVPDLSVTTRLEGPLMNARGFQDRLAIIGVAWNEYTASTSRMLFGIGLGTFLETSEDDFAVPLIIHNTYAWFLMELGPLGLIAFLWLMALTVLNIGHAWRRGGEWRALAGGLFAAFAGMLLFFMLNEGFYQRHFWLVFVFAERIRMFATAEAPAAATA